MGLVIVAIIATAGYIGYHASQETEVAEKHDIGVMPEVLEDTPSIHILEEIVVLARI